MFKDEKDKLTLTNRLPGKGLVLSLWCDDPAIIERFKQTCYENLTRETHWFHQCNAETYQMFEFWVGPQKLGLVQEQCGVVAADMEMILHVDVAEENFRFPA